MVWAVFTKRLLLSWVAIESPLLPLVPIVSWLITSPPPPLPPKLALVLTSSR